MPEVSVKRTILVLHAVVWCKMHEDFKYQKPTNFRPGLRCRKSIFFELLFKFCGMNIVKLKFVDNVWNIES